VLRLTNHLFRELLVIDRRLLLAATALLCATAAPAAAQEATTPEQQQIETDYNKDTVTIGIGAAYMPDYDGSNDYRVSPAPVAIGSVGGFNFSLIGNRASIDLIPNRNPRKLDIQFGPIGVINFDRQSVNAIYDPAIKALGKRATTLELGGYVGLGKTGVITSKYDRLAVSVSYRQGVTGAHRSYIWQPTINYITPLSTKVAVGFYGNAQYAGQGYADTYYTITPTQSIASGLPSFNAKAGWKSYGAGGFVAYSLTGNLLHGFKVMAGGTYTRLLGDFGYSPVVRIAGSKHQWLGAAGIAYTF
jgi:MipA family protein